jgi:hypothetical protein
MAKQKHPPVNKKKRPSKKIIIILIAVIVVSVIIVALLWHPATGVVDESNNSSATDYGIPTMENINQGKMLAQSHCATCHMLPDPALLNRAKWENVFPQMGLRLGIREHRGEIYTDAVKAPDLYIPAKPALIDEQWQDIIDYYMNTAPMQLPPQNRTVEIKRKMPFFSLLSPPSNFNGGKVLGCMVRIDSTVKPARIFVANGFKKKLYLLTNKLKVIDSIKTGGPVVDMLFDGGKIVICTIGKELGATSDKFGTVNELQVSKEGKMHVSPNPFFSGLARPVEILAADLNNDHQIDYVICEFGNIYGELCWMENKGNGSFTKHVIRGVPGAIKAYIDYSRDKNAPDLWVLFAQGEEGVYHFINNGKGDFDQKRVLRFPPVYGSSSFEMVDINHDGFKDIVYTCGDNGDATLVMKPYHGVYVFINDTHGNYIQKYFYPINGCYKAYARDFDGDGNIDIATISLFTDARQPEEGFVYLKNTGGLNFKPYALPQGTKFERAITMDEGDINGDGKPDLLIGNAFFDIGPFKKNIEEPLFYILKNKSK